MASLLNRVQPSLSNGKSSPWATAGCFISSYPALVSALFFLFFWIYRSQIYSGDGDQLSRMVEAGIWMVQTELASQAFFQLFYKILKPFGWDGFGVINLVSCIAGAVSVYILLLFNRDYVRRSPLWTLALFASSGLFLFCTGHTEYYTQFLATLFLYGYIALGYLAGRYSMATVALAFSAAAWMHLGILFATPSLLLLPLLRKQPRDFIGMAIGLLPTALAFLFKNTDTFMGVNIQGLSPSSNFVPFHDPIGVNYYTMFEWGHLLDFLYAWSIRSWIFWPAIVWLAWSLGWRSLFRPDRLFLLIYSLCFTFFTLTWHPNLGIYQDWDLFAIEAAPCLLLLLTYLPECLASSFHRHALAIPVTASVLITASGIITEAQFDRRDYGSMEVSLSHPINHSFTLNGHKKELLVPAIRRGRYEAKVIDRDNQTVYNFYVHVSPKHTTQAYVNVAETNKSK